MTPFVAVKTSLRKSFSFSGRSDRGEFWPFALFCLALVYLAQSADALLHANSDWEPPVRYSFGHVYYELAADTLLSPIAVIALIVPICAAGWRRLHDAGKPGWYLLIPLAFSAVFIAVAPFLNRETVGISLIRFLVTSAPIMYLGLWLAVLVWLINPSEPTTNKYGPNPKEVSQ
ncbi:DUF805 domain-containing protein [Halocynthiibacter namhaensis]|uniref:DUF805 domain-containing protein n=1 Tax=Halocynthiibacter namhaensis TaxID=1290553 RepID=UPI0005794577|nr:DUF805 domain-containing protein [Halocynthiibacter namhaensis]